MSLDNKEITVDMYTIHMYTIHMYTIHIQVQGKLYTKLGIKCLLVYLQVTFLHFFYELKIPNLFFIAYPCKLYKRVWPSKSW